MCSSDCEVCENLFSLNQEKREQAEYSQKACSCKDKDCPFCF